MHQNNMSELLKLNFGSGENYLPGYTNIDLEEKNKPDLVLDIRKSPLPYDNESVELINMFHCLEHIELPYWPGIFLEFHRVLILEGELRLAYPEFETCAKYFIENFHGERDFFRWTLYGMQRWPGDYHVVPMVTGDVVNALFRYGFHEVKSGPEPTEPYNTFLTARKTILPKTREDILREQIFHK